MPVVDSGVVVGMLSRQDILSILDRPDVAIATDVERVLNDDRMMPEDHSVTFSVDHGIVVLSGAVRYGWDAPIVVSMVRDLPGVIDVVSHLHAREPSPRPPAGPWMFGAR